MNVFLRLMAASGLIFLSTGCSSFNRDWKAAAQQPAATGDLSGAWDGQWLSQRNGHRGRLQCLMTKQGNDVYSARFKARYWKIFTAKYEIPMQVSPGTNNVYRLDGQKNLGKLAGGLYRYRGEATPEAIHTHYTNKYDHGTFEMKRPSVK